MCVSMYVHVGMYVCMYVCMFVCCMYICIYAAVMNWDAKRYSSPQDNGEENGRELKVYLK